MVEVGGVRLIIDAGPDFRQQMLRAEVRHIDAILLTHEHKDHIGGIDDVRAFNFVDYPTIHTVHIYANKPTVAALKKDYDYAFAENKYRGVPVIELHTIDEQQEFSVAGIDIRPIIGEHSSRFRSVGYRIGNFAYITDFSHINDAEVAKLEGVKVMVVNALRWEPHISHFTVDEAIALSRRVGAARTLLTHCSHQFGRYADIAPRLPEGVEPAYDMLSVEF